MLNYKMLTYSGRSVALQRETARLGPGRAVGTRSASLARSYSLWRTLSSNNYIWCAAEAGARHSHLLRELEPGFIRRITRQPNLGRGRAELAEMYPLEGAMDPKDSRLWYWIGFAVVALFVFSYGAGWFDAPIPGSPVP